MQANSLHFNLLDKVSFCFNPLMSNLTGILGKQRQLKTVSPRSSVLRTPQDHINTHNSFYNVSHLSNIHTLSLWVCNLRFCLMNLLPNHLSFQKCFSVMTVQVLSRVTWDLHLLFMDPSWTYLMATWPLLYHLNLSSLSAVWDRAGGQPWPGQEPGYP